MVHPLSTLDDGSEIQLRGDSQQLEELEQTQTLTAKRRLWMGILGPPPRNESKDSLEKALEIARAYAGSDNCDPKVLPELLAKVFHAVQDLKMGILKAEKPSSGSEKPGKSEK